MALSSESSGELCAGVSAAAGIELAGLEVIAPVDPLLGVAGSDEAVDTESLMPAGNDMLTPPATGLIDVVDKGNELLEGVGVDDGAALILGMPGMARAVDTGKEKSSSEVNLENKLRGR